MAKLNEIDFCLENFKAQLNKFTDSCHNGYLSELEIKYAHCIFLLGVLGNEQFSKAGKVLQELGLSSTSVHALNYIHGAEVMGEKIHSKELEDMLRVSNPTMSGVLKRLENKGYIARETDPDDARNKILRITKEGLEIKMKSMEVFNEFKNSYFREFSEEEIDTLSRLLIKILDSLIE